MGRIKRYHWNGDQSRTGELVLHSDHEAEVARLRAEVEGLRLVVSQVTECLCDTLHERGGWAIEEVIDMGREAAMGASA
ncbi:hypothetical protein [Stenotrophomonas maltophilia]|uniref:hypothetical protein n=1 Tax=Stenotrophomonas maltophilia TaxID=40324 RepID=UPI0007F8EE35|nr:hypothetical protein [Stenotrophomonas maltophilia]OBU59220.1 hypothetical protein A9K70_01470 [Stenotrophomonas maltophilia]